MKIEGNFGVETIQHRISDVWKSRNETLRSEHRVSVHFNRDRHNYEQEMIRDYTGKGCLFNLNLIITSESGSRCLYWVMNKFSSDLVYLSNYRSWPRCFRVSNDDFIQVISV